MNRRTRIALVVGWAVLLGWSLMPRLERLAAARAEGLPAAGDPELDRDLAAVAALAREVPDVLLVCRAPAEEREYLEFRAKFLLYPARPVVAFREGAWAGELSVSGPAAETVHARGIRLAVGWERAAGLRRLRIVSAGPAAVRLAEVAGAVPRPAPATGPGWGRWLAAVLILVCGTMLAWRRLGGAPPGGGGGMGPADLLGLLAAAVAVALAIAQAVLPQSAWATWDAWAVWDFKTKAMLHEGWLPRAFLTDPAYRFAHPEYPLLWPWLQAGLCRAAGGFDVRLLRLTSVLFAAAMPPLLAALLAEVGVARGRWLIAGAVALLPAVLDQSANGYVDWPLAVAETAACVALLRTLRGSAAPEWAGVLAGVAANLKQEGLVCGLGVLLVLGVHARSGRLARGGWARAAAAFLLLAVPWRAVAWSWHLTPGDFGFAAAAFARNLPGRFGLFGRAFGLEAFGPGLGGASFASGLPIPWREWTAHLRHAWLAFWFAAAWATIRGWRGLRAPGRRDLAALLGVQVAGAILAYGATILDPRWLLAASLDRVMLQWVPAVAVLTASLAQGKGRPGV